MGLYHTLLGRAEAREELNLAPQWQRLRMLENAVLNYGGGLAVLQARAEAQAALHREGCPDAAAVLLDVARYLHDIAEVGGLDLRDNATFLRDLLP